MSDESKSLKSARSALKLSDTQLVLLSAAAQRDDHCLTVTPNLKRQARFDSGPGMGGRASSRHGP